MTEEEAKTKSCCGPMQAEFGKSHVVNCIGSACMAWRWEGSDYSDDFVADDETIIAQWAEAGWRTSDERNDKGHVKMLRPLLTQGFCGLAGKP